MLVLGLRVDGSERTFLVTYQFSLRFRYHYVAIGVDIFFFDVLFQIYLDKYFLQFFIHLQKIKPALVARALLNMSLRLLFLLSRHYIYSLREV